jgi:hypothetical protein
METREQIEARRDAAEERAAVYQAEIREAQAQVAALRQQMRAKIQLMDVELLEIQECNVLLINPQLFQRIGV